MAKIEQVRGYLLEESLAWLLRNSGYELITSVSPSDPWLVMGAAGLAVRGRGAEHQADVLGEYVFTPPFSLPIRMFVEAKFYADPVGLDTVRNAWATVSDINEFDVGAHPHARYRYVYALFSASGFTTPAQRFAATHQISLIDLSLEAYRPMLDAVEAAAGQVLPQALGRGRVRFVRDVFRNVLDTAGDAIQTDALGVG
ncbi:restriction endonuclease [Micromonospora sp. CPCC 205371]|nr:restriction endonuclease [Micromonospora sp. CPCC 205371]